ncbi:hypothetical protein CEW88_11575 [Alloyangia pacifica]|uniref:Helix-turn-helix domain-containing protein n=1 Tax=Alloyangia pacifica TaxID=311180 RepID=A0A2U8HEG9_9RHOB|nr:helix-turn-helix domain-containing protein [Alloyangia pacifica]AWI84267.1 hypothetical protein CEW88_11575 [Alloyangia pacifica]
MTHPPHKLLTEDEAAEYLDDCGYPMQPSTLRNYRSSNRGPHYVRAGRSPRYRVADLHKWLTELPGHENTLGELEHKLGIAPT